MKLQKRSKHSRFVRNAVNGFDDERPAHCIAMFMMGELFDVQMGAKTSAKWKSVFTSKKEEALFVKMVVMETEQLAQHPQMKPLTEFLPQKTTPECRKFAEQTLKNPKLDVEAFLAADKASWEDEVKPSLTNIVENGTRLVLALQKLDSMSPPSELVRQTRTIAALDELAKVTNDVQAFFASQSKRLIQQLDTYSLFTDLIEERLNDLVRDGDGSYEGMDEMDEWIKGLRSTQEMTRNIALSWQSNLATNWMGLINQRKQTCKNNAERIVRQLRVQYAATGLGSGGGPAKTDAKQS